MLSGFAALAAQANLRFEVTLNSGLSNSFPNGRLFIILSRLQQPEPRFLLGRAGRDAPCALARDVEGFSQGKTAVVDHAAFMFPFTNLLELPAREYLVQALFAGNHDLRLLDAPGNLYGDVRYLRVDPMQSDPVRLVLRHGVGPDRPPPDTAELKYLKFQSTLLSRFHQRPMFLRAGIILPRDYAHDPARRFPLWVRIGGFGTRYTAVQRLMAEDSGFRKIWMADHTPRFVLLQLDGAGPYGDPYYVNSDNNGPYGDALVQELIPEVERRFRCLGQPGTRVLSGASTGGWVSLALQVLYPDSFNGTWSSCPDPVDFRALELTDIYSETNMYLNRYGNERPSERNLKGDTVLLTRRETAAENLLGRGNTFVLSGEQWGSWNAVYSPRGEDGMPLPLWNSQTGAIDRTVAEHWKNYDLRLLLERDWKTLAPKLRGKLHIAVGEADQYFLNNAVHLLDDFLSRADPPSDAKLVYGPGKGHGWFDLSLEQMLEEMQRATERR